ncbi:MAG: S24 family peptidase [Burkholderiaceae bacterium]
MENRDIRLNNLKYAIWVCGSIEALAERAECNKKYLEQIIQGFQGPKDKNPRSLGNQIAPRIARAIGQPSHWIDQINSEQWMEIDTNDFVSARKSSGQASNVVKLQKKKPDDITIRQYETGGAMGAGLELRDQPGIIQSWRVNPEWLERNVRAHSSAKNLCIVTGFGDSMQPLFNPGDPLLVDVGVLTVDFDSIYFFRIGNDGYVKRLQRIPTEDGLIIRAVSENRDAYEPFNITQKMDFQVLGRVLKVWRSQDF